MTIKSFFKATPLTATANNDSSDDCIKTVNVDDIQDKQSNVIQLPDIQEVRENIKNREKISDLAFIFSRKKVKEFLQEHCLDLMTEDVLENKSFIEGVESSFMKIKRYLNFLEKYSRNQARTKETDLSKKMTLLSNKIKVLKEKMKHASSIKINMKMGVQQISVSAAAKQDSLAKVLACASVINEFIDNENILYKLKKRFDQQQARKNKEALLMEKSQLSLKCLNVSLKWETAYHNIISQTAKNLPNGTSVLEMLQIATQVEEETFLSGDNVTLPDRKGKIDFLLENFPIMFASRGDTDILINLHELLIDKELFVNILFDGEKEDVIEIPVTSVNKTPAPFIGPKRKRGRKPYYEKYPTLIDVVTNFIKQHSFAAHGRRRETTGTGNNLLSSY